MTLAPAAASADTVQGTITYLNPVTSPANSSDLVTLKASVQADDQVSSLPETPEGDVTFYADDNPVSCADSAVTAETTGKETPIYYWVFTCDAYFTAGDYTISAAYNGGADAAPSNSTDSTESDRALTVVDTTQETTTVADDLYGYGYGFRYDDSTFVAAVHDTTEGVVNFYDGETLIDGCEAVTANADDGYFYCTTNALTAGYHTITASYQGLEGRYAASSDSFDYYVIPRPHLLKATAGDGNVALNWTAPEVTEEFPAAVGYIVNVYQGDSFVTSDDSGAADPTTSKTISGLTNGTDYWFTVAAMYCDGSQRDCAGPESNALHATPTAAVVTPPTDSGSSDPGTTPSPTTTTNSETPATPAPVVTTAAFVTTTAPETDSTTGVVSNPSVLADTTKKAAPAVTKEAVTVDNKTDKMNFPWWLIITLGAVAGLFTLYYLADRRKAGN